MNCLYNFFYFFLKNRLYKSHPFLRPNLFVIEKYLDRKVFITENCKLVLFFILLLEIYTKNQSLQNLEDFFEPK